MNPAHFRALEAMYHEGPINRLFQPRLQIDRIGEAVIISSVNPDWFHAAGSLHGAVYFKMLDDAAYFAAQSGFRDHFLVTASFNLYFTRPIASGEMRAEGVMTDRSRTQTHCQAVLYNNGKVAARGSGLFVPSRVALDGGVGYHPERFEAP